MSRDNKEPGLAASPPPAAAPTPPQSCVKPVHGASRRQIGCFRYNLRVRTNVWQGQGDKAKGSRGGITAVQQSCQSTGGGGCTQPTVSLQTWGRLPAQFKALWSAFNGDSCQDINLWTLCQDLSHSLIISRLFFYLRNSRDAHRYAGFGQNLTIFTSNLIINLHYKLIKAHFPRDLSCSRPVARISSCLTHRPRVTFAPLCCVSHPF